METLEGQSSVPKTIQRSAGYPADSLETSIEFVSILSTHFSPSHTFTRDDVAAVLSKSHGSVIRPVAAAVHYGLLAKEGEGYKITPVVKVIKNSLSDSEKKKVLLEAFSKPTLFADIIEKFDGHAVPVDLKPHLIRFHKIVDKVAPEVETIFRESAAYADAISASGILNVKRVLNNLADGVDFVEIVESKKNDKQTAIEIFEPKPKGHIGYDYSDDLVELKIPLPNKKFAYLKYPQDLTSKDVSILLKQLELLQALTTD